MPCVYQCRSPFGAYRQGPCKECMAKADRLMDEQYELYQEGKAYMAFRKSEATDREYAEYLDRVCPVVISPRDRPIVNGHVIMLPSDCQYSHEDSRSCVICDGGLQICINCGAAEIELREPCKATIEQLAASIF